MHLITYQWNDGLTLGVRTRHGVLDVAAARATLGGYAPTTIMAALAGGDGAMAALRALVARAEADDRGPVWHHAESSLRFAACVSNPGKILCVGLNYRLHAEESGMPIPDSPVLFAKFPNGLRGHGETIPLPADDPKIDYEAELCIMIGTRARAVSERDALRYVAGYCNANDVSARGLQMKTSQWILGKALDGFCPIGPALVTRDEIPNPGALRIQAFVNGERRQDSNTADMVFGCGTLIAYISRYITLEPGDLILTGTPSGVALGRPDKPWLRAGDEVAIEIEGLGRLVNRVGT
ncbi:MAG: fumarylacetoacetate hydrolase family protein [Armatimonadetes bacterium]|nr:fumarylacetoacetate hydrolase family protein [Armatimonadota bacterium]